MNSSTRVLLWLALASTPGVVLFAAAMFYPATWLLWVAAAMHLLALGAVGRVVYFALLEPLLLVQRRAKLLEAGASARVELGPLAIPEVKQLGSALDSLDRQLHEQQSALDAAKKRHTQAIREIHHRVKNNLQVVSSLLSLQANRLKVPEGRADFDMARQRLSALALLHRHLYDGRDFESIELRAFCSDLVEHLRELAGYDRNALIRTQIDVPPQRINADQGVLIGLIITETVTNAFRHAFPGKRPGTIKVAMTVQAGRAHLTISDDGVGLPEGRLSGTGTDLGGLLIAGFVRQLHGSLSIRANSGTHLDIEFPLDPIVPA